jgi:hypothetical protein
MAVNAHAEGVADQDHADHPSSLMTSTATPADSPSWGDVYASNGRIKDGPRNAEASQGQLDHAPIGIALDICSQVVPSMREQGH